VIDNSMIVVIDDRSGLPAHREMILLRDMAGEPAA